MEPPAATDPVTAPVGPCRAARDAARAGLYVHVPFCAVRCSYCDFSTGALTRGGLARWLDAIEREFALRAPAAAGLRFTSVFFGGGTPSALPSWAFRRVWSALSAAFALAPDAEITLEANPESVRASLLETWAAAGVNRLSMGAQSFDPAELAMLGRVHSDARPEQAFALARAHGFERLSLDLMFGYPGHDAAVFARTIERALALDPEHVSAYCFIPEAGTPLGDAVRSGARPLPPPERQAELYDLLDARLAAAGLACYETSNFCRPGAEARHNLVYWLRRPYLGCGPSAHSLLGGGRLGNHYALARWAQALERGEDPAETVEPEDARTREREVVMLGLRLSSGLDPADHDREAFAELLAHYGPAFEHAVATGRLERAGEAWRIPRPLRFVADDVIAWIDARADAGPVDTPLSASVTSSACHSPHSRVA